MAPRLPITPTQDLLADTPGLKAFIQGQNIVALYGMAIDSDPTLSARGLADRFLFGDVGYPAQADALGVEFVDLVYKNEVTTGDDRFTVVTYTQEIDDLPVHGTSVKIQVMLKDHPDGLLNGNTISYIGMRLVYLPADLLPEGTFNDQAARDKVTARYGFTTFWPIPADEVVYQADDDSMHRAWRFRAWDEDEAYLFFVDTTTGDIVGVVNQLLSAEVTGKVRGYATPTTPDLKPHSPSNLPVIEDLPGVEVFVYPGNTCPATPWTDPAIELSGDDENNMGEYGPIQFDRPGWLGSRLKGQWVTVYDCHHTWPCAPQEVTVCAEQWVECPGGHNDCPAPHTCGILNTCEGGFCSNDPRLICDFDSECYFCSDTRGTACPNENECGVDEVCITSPTCAVGNLCTHDSLLHCTTDNDCWYCSQNLIFNQSQTTDDTAAVNAFLVTEETHKWFAALLGDSTLIDQNVRAEVNLSGGSSAGYTLESTPPTLFFRAEQPTRENAAFSTVISHEYGHFVLDQFTSVGSPTTFHFHEGYADTASFLKWDTDCIGQDWWPAWSCLRYMDAVNPDEPYKCFSGGPGCKCSNIGGPCIDPESYRCDDESETRGCEVQLGDGRCIRGFLSVHCRGLALAGSFWDLRKQLTCCADTPGGPCNSNPLAQCTVDGDCPSGHCSDLLTEQIFANFTPVTAGQLDERVLVEVLTADDDDANLTNGTPHDAEILCAFIGAGAVDCATGTDPPVPPVYLDGFDCTYIDPITEEVKDQIGHGWPCPVIGQGDDGRVKVDWFGPVGAYLHPVRDTDYTINYDLNPPVVTLISTEAGDPGQELAVRTWFVGCEDSAGTACDLGGVHAEWEAAVPELQEGVVVKVGTTPTEPCNDLHVIDIPRYADTKYSNIELYLADTDEEGPDGSLLGRARCEAGTGGQGGLIAGTIDRDAHRVRARAVGAESGGPTSLHVAFFIENSILDTIEQGTTLLAWDVVNFLQLNGELNGNIQLSGNLDQGRIEVLGSGESTGGISVGGEIASSQATAGAGMRITGNMSGDISVTGDITRWALVEIDGEFNGDICARNVTPGMAIGVEPLDNITIGNFGPNASVCGMLIECNVGADCLSVSTCVDASCDGGWCVYADNGSCTVAPPTRARVPHNAPKNRYISFNPTNDGRVAFRIELKQLTLGSCSGNGGSCREDRKECSVSGGQCTLDADCPQGETCSVWSDCNICSVKRCSSSLTPCDVDGDCPTGETCQVTPCINQPIDCPTGETCDPTGETCVNDRPDIGGTSVGQVWWVGEPRDPSCQDLDSGALNGEPCLGKDYISRVVDTPYYNDPLGPPWPTTVHVGDCEIVPVATYWIQATTDETTFSTEFEVKTTDQPGSNYWADGVGESFNGLWWRPPDGATNVNDIQAAQHTFRSFGNYPHITWVDIHGSGFAGDLLVKELAPPNYLVNVGDLQFIGLAFTGRPYPFADPGDCPASPQGRSPAPDPIIISLVADAELIDPGNPVNVDVYIDDVDNLGAYQVALQVSGGTSGELLLTAITVDTQRTDYVFYGESPQITTDLQGGRTGATMTGGGGVSVTTSGYLATFTYQAAQGALGVFQISVVGGNASFVNDASGTWLDSVGGDAEVVGSGIDCYNDGHCDDSNDCTTDTCTSNECGYTNVASGTACDDGLWCTKKGSTCDGNGNCTGGTPRCQPGEICDEQAQLCIGEAP